jgi:hypothetical protein
MDEKKTVVQFVALIGGDVFLAKTYEEEKHLIILNPLRVIPVKDETIKFFPWVFGMDFSQPFPISYHAIVALVPAEPNLVKQYVEKTSIIKMPPTNVQLSLLQEGKK